jgi:hypothetical protein
VAHAAVVEVTIDAASGAAHRCAILQSLVIPEVKALPGFVRGTWLDDGEGTATCIAVFEHEAQARDGLLLLTSSPGPPVLRAGVQVVDAEA